MALYPEKDQRLACKSVCPPARQLYCTKELGKEAEHDREGGTSSEGTGRAVQSMTGVPGVLRLCQCEVWVQGKLRRHMYMARFSVVLTCACVCASGDLAELGAVFAFT